MFRLVQVLNGNTQADIHLLPNNNYIFMPGEAVNVKDGKLISTTSSVAPDYMILSYARFKKVNVQIVNANSVFKVEYVGTIEPYLGMPVGISTFMVRSDAVTYNANGKGTVIGIDDDKRKVYVKFRK